MNKPLPPTTSSSSTVFLPLLGLGPAVEAPVVRPARGEQLRFDQRETRALLGTKDVAAAGMRFDESLALDDRSVLLRRMPSGQIGLLASLPQDVTSVEITITSPSGSSRTITVPKDSDFEAKLRLGKLSDGTKISVTPISGSGAEASRGPAHQIVWSSKTPPSENLKAHQKELEALARDAGWMEPRELASRIAALSEKVAHWPDSDQLYLWSDAGTALRHRLHGAFEEIAENHPDLKLPGGGTFSDAAQIARDAEAAWQQQIDRLAKAVDVA